MKKIFIAFAALFFMKNIYSQGSSFYLSYPISFPMGDLSEYIDAVSYRGISLEWYKRAKPQLDVGLEIAWNVFYERVDSKTYTDGTASISGVQYRYTSAVPMIAGVKYHLDKGGKAVPYGGIGLGVTYVNRSTDFGLYRITNDAWQFTVRPELGVAYKINPDLAILLGAKYFMPFNGDNLDGQQYLSLNLGLVFYH